MIRIVAALFCACVCLSAPAYSQDIFAGIRSIDVTMTKVESCIASHYGVGDGYHGRRTASGERFNTYALTAAFVKGRFIDLSYTAARAIGMGGLARVTVD